MKLKSFFRFKFIFLSLILVIISSLIYSFFDKGIFLMLSFANITISSTSPSEPFAACAAMISNTALGWPFAYLTIIGSSACNIMISINPLGGLINILFFLGLINLISYKKWIFTGLIIVILFGLSLFFIRNESSNNIANINNQKKINNSNFVKKNFNNEDDFFADGKYPNLILNIDEKDLIGLTCKEYKYCSFDSCQDDKSNEITLDDTLRFYIKSIQTLNEEIKKTNNDLLKGKIDTSYLDDMAVCQTEDSRIFIKYELQKSGGGAGTLPIIALMKSDQTLEYITSFEDQSAYFGCLKPLLLTKDNDLYYECSGGEGQIKYIYQININQKTSQIMYKCQEIWQNSRPAGFKCE